MIVTTENRWVLSILKELFPGIKIYENDVPKDFKRPNFVLIEPVDKISIKEVTKLSVQRTVNVTLYMYYEEGKTDVAVNMEASFMQRLYSQKKHLIPDSDKRYLTLEECGSNTDTVENLIEFSIQVSRTLAHTDPDATPATKIKNIVIQHEGGEKNNG